MYTRIKESLKKAGIFRTPPHTVPGWGEYLVGFFLEDFPPPDYNFRGKMLDHSKNKYLTGITYEFDPAYGKPNGQLLLKSFLTASFADQLKYLTLCALEWPYESGKQFPNKPELEKSLENSNYYAHFTYFITGRVFRIIPASLLKLSVGLITHPLEVGLLKTVYHYKKQNEESKADNLAAVPYGLLNSINLLLSCLTNPLDSYYAGESIHPLLGYVSAAISSTEIGTGLYYAGRKSIEHQTYGFTVVMLLFLLAEVIQCSCGILDYQDENDVIPFDSIPVELERKTRRKALVVTNLTIDRGNDIDILDRIPTPPAALQIARDGGLVEDEKRASVNRHSHWKNQKYSRDMPEPQPNQILTNDERKTREEKSGREDAQSSVRSPAPAS